MSFRDLSAYGFSEIKSREHSRAPDKAHLEDAVLFLTMTIEILERIDDEMLFPIHEYETLADVRTELINHLQEM